ncbi:MAG: uracil-DNA glycosylase family protein [Candidatus Firestonebacteria bacterium]
MKKFIEKMGSELVKCDLNCEGVISDPRMGILPRCLFFEDNKGKNGVIVVGLNPGHSDTDKEQRKYYIKNKCSYESTVKYWEEKNWGYFKKIREFIEIMNFNGPIIWTELVKCECLEKETFEKIPLQTIRTCIDKFLRKEIKKCPDNYIIIAVGKEAFKFCSLSFPKKFVIGVPHSSGSYSSRLFTELLEDVKNNKNKYKKMISRKKDINGYVMALWLKP